MEDGDVDAKPWLLALQVEVVELQLVCAYMIQ